SSSVGAASSWPGVTVSESTGFFAYGTQIYALDTQNGSLLWNYPAEPQSGRQFYAAPGVGADFVVVGDYSNTLAAVDKQSGVEKWQFSGANDRYVGSALVANGSVFAPNTDHFMYALDESGNLAWRFEAQGPNWTQPAADENYVYLASMDHFVYALKKAYTAAELKPAEDGSSTLVSEPVWSLDLGAAVVADPVLAEGILYTGTIDGKLYAIDLASQAILWSFDGNGALASIWGSPVVTANAVFVGDEDGNIFAVGKSDGKTLWPDPFAAGSGVISSGTVMEDRVVFATNTGKIFTINENKELKTLVTLEATLYSPLELDTDKIIVAPATKEKLFVALNADGNEVWNYYPEK
ncbi:MAG: PQQ-binding-like beta-propeller repeat protein, partial [Chloroflexota bacterium]